MTTDVAGLLRLLAKMKDEDGVLVATRAGPMLREAAALVDALEAENARIQAENARLNVTMTALEAENHALRERLNR